MSKVEKALAELVQSARQSKQPKRSHAFPPANMVRRQAAAQGALWAALTCCPPPPKKNKFLCPHLLPQRRNFTTQKMKQAQVVTCVRANEVVNENL